MIAKVRERNGITYKDFPIEKRAAGLHDPRIQNLINVLPNEISQKMVTSYLKNNHTGQDAKEVLEYFLTISSITQAVVDDKGGANIFYYLYNKIADNPIDQYFLECNAGHQIYRRLKTLEKRIPDILRTLFPGRGLITIDNIGSGQGYDMINILANPNNKDLRNRVHVRNIDPNEVALQIGWGKLLDTALKEILRTLLMKLEAIKVVRLIFYLRVEFFVLCLYRFLLE